MKRFLSRLFLIFAALSSINVPANAAIPSAGVGFQFMRLKDPVSGTVMRAAVFYPASTMTVSTQVGDDTVAAQEGATPANGKWPLVLVSHGSGGGMLGHHDSLTDLSANGFIAAALEHPGDNFWDQSGLGTDRVLAGRPLQLGALLDYLLEDATFGQIIDRTRVGALGFSAGGYTALAAAGAVPKFELLKDYCSRHPKSVLCSGGNVVKQSNPPQKLRPDERIKAVFIMSPVGAFFDAQSFASYMTPTRIFAAADDTILPPAENARKLQMMIKSVTEYSEIPLAGHFVFLAPCSAAAERALPHVCRDTEGVNRLEIHETLNQEMVRFFETYLSSTR